MFFFDTMDYFCLGDGFLMSKYCVSFETMKSFINNLNSSEINCQTIEDLVKKNIFFFLMPFLQIKLLWQLELITLSKEFEDIILRNNEKSHLNELNKSKNSKTIRFPLNSKIKTNAMKTNV